MKIIEENWPLNEVNKVAVHKIQVPVYKLQVVSTISKWPQMVHLLILDAHNLWLGFHKLQFGTHKLQECAHKLKAIGYKLNVAAQNLLFGAYIDV